MVSNDNESIELYLGRYSGARGIFPSVTEHTVLATDAGACVAIGLATLIINCPLGQVFVTIILPIMPSSELFGAANVVR